MENRLEKWVEEALKHAIVLQELSVKAGNAIMEIYRQDFDVMKKADTSPLTQADLAAHRIIADGLMEIPGPLGNIPQISEEGEIPGFTERASWEAWWLIDPLDGTKEFVKRNGEFTVNMALIIRESSEAPGIPAAGWVYAPVPQILYQGISGSAPGSGGFKIDCRENDKGISEGIGQRMKLSREPAAGIPKSPRIVASRSHRNPETEALINAVGKKFGKEKIISSGSSLKLCRIAEGSAELYPRPAPTMEWDTAAADAVCRASGVQVVNARSGESLKYGKKNLLNPWFLVSADEKLLSLAVAVLKEESSK